MTSSGEDESTSAAHEHRWYTVAAETAASTTAVAARASLLAQRPRLSRVGIDLLSDRPWPADVIWAVEAGTVLADGRRRLHWPSRKPPISAWLDPRHDDEFAIAVALAPYTICGYASDQERTLVWDCSDTGTSVALRLTAPELASVRSAVAASGGDPQQIAPLR